MDTDLILNNDKTIGLLDKADKSCYHSKPFPYYFKQSALDPRFCDELIAQYPPFDLLAGSTSHRNNARFNFGVKNVLESKLVPDIWRNFVLHHANINFFHQFIDLFGAELLYFFPQIGSHIKDWKALKLGIRKINDFSTHDVLIDVQIGGNTPVQKTTSVRARHIDDPRKLFGALYYLRLNEDNSQGGDLELSFPKKENHYKYYNHVYVRDQYAQIHDTVPYKKNNFVLFLNTPVSWHGVTPRLPTHHPRLFVNLVAEFKEPLFSVDNRQEFMDLLLRKLKIRRYGKNEY